MAEYRSKLIGLIEHLNGRPVKMREFLELAVILWVAALVFGCRRPTEDGIPVKDSSESYETSDAGSPADTGNGAGRNGASLEAANGDALQHGKAVLNRRKLLAYMMEKGRDPNALIEWVDSHWADLPESERDAAVVNLALTMCNEHFEAAYRVVNSRISEDGLMKMTLSRLFESAGGAKTPDAFALISEQIDPVDQESYLRKMMIGASSSGPASLSLVEWTALHCPPDLLEGALLGLIDTSSWGRISLDEARSISDWVNRSSLPSAMAKYEMSKFIAQSVAGSNLSEAFGILRNAGIDDPQVWQRTLSKSSAAPDDLLAKFHVTPEDHELERLALSRWLSGRLPFSETIPLISTQAPEARRKTIQLIAARAAASGSDLESVIACGREHLNGDELASLSGRLLDCCLSRDVPMAELEVLTGQLSADEVKSIQLRVESGKQQFK